VKLRRDLFSKLSENHPRLFLSAKRMRMLQDGSADNVLVSLKTTVLLEADALLQTEPSEFKIIGPRMLPTCQQVFRRVATLALAFRLTGLQRYLDRARGELFAAANFPHWNPDHFLDTAELCSAFAVGYDWLHDSLPDSDRCWIRETLVDKGLRPGLELQQKPAWWVSVRHNWNTVCNGGLAIGALALAEDEPQLAMQIINTSLARMRVAQDCFAPDGAWEAGPHYWEYTVWYSALTSDALKTAMGTDMGLSARTGFNRAGLFALHCSGPSGKYFNFADSDESPAARPGLFWLGKRFKLLNCVAENHRWLQNGGQVHPFDLIWYQRFPKRVPGLPTCAYFRRSEVVFMRTGWSDSDALFVGIKGGSGQSDHAHLDLGSFVLDAAGIRWASDLGPDDYDLPGYWDSSKDGQRWKYYRLNNLSHNTLALNGHTQDPMSTTQVLRVECKGSIRYVIVDLSAAYSQDSASVLRGVAIVEGCGVLLQDEIVWRRDSEDRLFRWQMMTDAKVVVNGSEATLHKEGRSLHARILSPVGATFSIACPSRRSHENPNIGYRQLVVEKCESGVETRIAVQLSVKPFEYSMLPLDSW
jgi:hypothetical protein